MASSNYTFDRVPTIHHRRTRFTGLSYSHKTSLGQAGLAYPVYIQEIYPGDSFSVKATAVVRATNGFIRPVMDNAFVDMMFFFVPNRLCMDEWAQVMGDPGNNPWVNNSPPTVPQIELSGTSVPVGSISDYFGIPTHQTYAAANDAGLGQIIPYRALALIWNDWLRDENLEAPKNVVKTSTLGTYEKILATLTPWGSSPNSYCSGCPTVCKTHDYFTSCLPAPQRGEAIDVIAGQIPLNTSDEMYSFANTTHPLSFLSRIPVGGTGPFSLSAIGSSSNNLTPIVTSVAAGSGSNSLTGTNLYADLQNGLNVNDLRLAFQTQKILERAARSGGRYIEYIRSAFGVDPGDARLQRTEYLGGSRNPLNVQQVAQTSQTSDTNYLGDVGAFSLSAGQAKFSKGFTEHGFVIGIACVRYYHTYQQGIERFWGRRSRFDWYDPAFQSIGEQPVYSYEIYAGMAGTLDRTNVFGYQEPFADLRSRPNRVSGMLRSDPTSEVAGFDIWHFGDEYANAPTLSADWIHENPDFIQRTLNGPDDGTAPQFIADFYFDVSAVRVLPAYGVPSLIDHH